MLAPLVSLQQLKDLMNDQFTEAGEEAQALATLTAVSSWARVVAGKDFLTGVVPDGVQSVVLSASRRDYNNSEGYIKQAMGSLNVELSPNRVPDGFFTPAETSILVRSGQVFGGLRSISTYREEEDFTWGYLFTLPDDSGKPMRLFSPKDGPINGAMYL